MRFKNQELLTSAILYLFPWTGSLFGGWYLVEGIRPIAMKSPLPSSPFSGPMGLIRSTAASPPGMALTRCA